MDLALDPSAATRYKSPSQRARVITEQWATANLYCPACACDELKPLPRNEKVADYSCQDCTARYQLKSTAGSFGGSVTNSAYQPKMDAIRNGTVPHYAFLSYSPQRRIVTDLFVVPGYFFTPAVVEERPALGPTARRHGWIGSNILLRALPLDARVMVISAEQALPPADVRNAWSQFAFLGVAENAKGGWGADTLMCVREMQRATGLNEFVLQDFYRSFKGHLGSIHPDNRNVQDKIRQQFQILRDNGVLRFLGRGRYRIVR
ncbi:MAG: restriction endonuclease [Chloroflexi bacterium]|nr:restriction endonuclease [Chloroflexota bacterium]